MEYTQHFTNTSFRLKSVIEFLGEDLVVTLQIASEAMLELQIHYMAPLVPSLVEQDVAQVFHWLFIVLILMKMKIGSQVEEQSFIILEL